MKILGASIGLLAAGAGIFIVAWPFMDAFLLPYFYAAGLEACGQWGLLHPKSVNGCRGHVIHHHLPNSEGKVAAPEDSRFDPKALDNFRSMLEDLDATGRGNVVVLSGGPGVGKTSLVRSLADLPDASCDDAAAAAAGGKVYRPMGYLSLRAATVSSSVVLFTMLSALLRDPLGHLGSFIVSMQELYNAFFDMLTMNQNHDHVSFIMFAVGLKHLRGGLLLINESMAAENAERLRLQNQPAATELQPGDATLPTTTPATLPGFRRKPVVIIDHLEDCIRGPLDGGAKNMVDLAVPLLIRSAVDENLCHVVFVTDSRCAFGPGDADTQPPSSPQALIQTPLLQRFPLLNPSPSVHFVHLPECASPGTDPEATTRVLLEEEGAQKCPPLLRGAVALAAKALKSAGETISLHSITDALDASFAPVDLNRVGDALSELSASNLLYPVAGGSLMGPRGDLWRQSMPRLISYDVTSTLEATAPDAIAEAATLNVLTTGPPNGPATVYSTATVSLRALVGKKAPTAAAAIQGMTSCSGPDVVGRLTSACGRGPGGAMLFDTKLPSFGPAPLPPVPASNLLLSQQPPPIQPALTGRAIRCLNDVLELQDGSALVVTALPPKEASRWWRDMGISMGLGVAVALALSARV